MNVSHQNLKIQSLNTAIKYNTKLLSQSLINQQSSYTHSISTLGRILKNKNQHYRYEMSEQKFKSGNSEQYESVPPKALELRGLADRVRKTTKQHAFKRVAQKEKKEQIQKLMYDFQFNYTKNKDKKSYLVDHNQYFIKKTIGESFKNQNKRQRDIKLKVFSKIENINSQLSHEQKMNSKLKSVAISNARSQQQNSHQTYINFVKHLMIHENSITNIDTFLQLKCGQLWNIINMQIKNYQYAKNKQKKNPQIAIIMTSIKIIQELFRKSLSDSESSINSQIQRNYIDPSKKSEYVYDTKKQLRWGIAYMYYKSGSYPRFLSKISEQQGKHGAQMRKAFDQLHQSIDQLDPKPQHFQQSYQIVDPFYRQLVYLLKGQITFSDNKIFRINTLDFVWLVLRQIKLFSNNKSVNNRNSHNEKMFDKLLQALEEYLIDNEKQISSIQTVKNLLYLNAYELLISLNSTKIFSKIISQEDYLHILIILYFCPYLLSPSSNGSLQIFSMVDQQLSQQLKKFISNILNSFEEKQNQYALFYILLIPTNYLEEILPRVFDKLQKFEKVDHVIIDGISGWDYIQYKIQNKQTNSDQSIKLYRNALQGVFNGMLQKQNRGQQKLKIILEAQKFFIQDRDFFYQILIKTTLRMMCDRLYQNENRKNIMNKEKVTEQRIQKYLKVLARTYQNQKLYMQKYAPQINFIKNYQELQKLVKIQDIYQLKKFHDSQQYINNLEYLLPEAVTIRHQSKTIITLINFLYDINCMDLFEDYAKTFMISYANISAKRGRYTECDQYRALIIDRLKRIDFNKFEKQQQMTINDSLYKNNMRPETENRKSINWYIENISMKIQNSF